jgi:hypothetical protein
MKSNQHDAWAVWLVDGGNAVVVARQCLRVIHKNAQEAHGAFETRLVDLSPPTRCGGVARLVSRSPIYEFGQESH